MKKSIISLAALFLSLVIFASPVFANTNKMHTVNQGESYYLIAKKYGLSVQALKNMNRASNNNIYPGQLLKVGQVHGKTISVSVNGRNIDMYPLPYLDNSTTFVPVRFVAEALNLKVDWDNHTRTAIIEFKGYKIYLPVGEQYAIVNGKYVDLRAGTQLYEGRTFVPLRFLAETIGANVEWNQNNYHVTITSDDAAIAAAINSYKADYSEEDLYWLSRIVEAEAQGEPYSGKLAVANVVINRKNSKDFPNTIKGVIFDRKHGVQYTPIIDGTIYNTPSKESVAAAKEALMGNNNIGDALFFVNPSKATNSWIMKNRTLYTVIGNHHFYQ